MNFPDNPVFRTRNLATSPQYKPGVQESTPQNHHGLAGGLFELHLDAGKLLVYDLHHPLDLLRRDWPCAALFPQQIHHVGSELITCLKRTTKTGASDVPKLKCLSLNTRGIKNIGGHVGRNLSILRVRWRDERKKRDERRGVR